MNGRQDVTEQVATDRDLGQLERDGAGMTDDPRANFDQPCLEAGQRPVGYLLGKVCTLQEDPEIVGQCMKLKPNLVLRHPFA